MRLLLDTHTFFWFILNNPLLSSNARNLISDPNNEIEISPATYWEIAIKIRIGKYSIITLYNDSGKPIDGKRICRDCSKTLELL